MVCFRLLSSIRPFWFFWSQAGSNLCVPPSCPSERSRLVFLVTGGLEPLRFAILPIGEIAFADVSKLDKGLFWNRLNFSWATIISGLEIHRETLKVIFVFRLCEPQEVFR